MRKLVQLESDLVAGLHEGTVALRQEGDHVERRGSGNELGNGLAGVDHLARGHGERLDRAVLGRLDHTLALQERQRVAVVLDAGEGLLALPQLVLVLVLQRCQLLPGLIEALLGNAELPLGLRQRLAPFSGSEIADESLGDELIIGGDPALLVSDRTAQARDLVLGAPRPGLQGVDLLRVVVVLLGGHGRELRPERLDLSVGLENLPLDIRHVDAKQGGTRVDQLTGAGLDPGHRAGRQ